MKDWTEAAVRTAPPMSAVEPAVFPAEMQPAVGQLLAGLRESVAEPFRGITTEGSVLPGLFTGTGGTVDTAGIRAAATAFLDALDAEGRRQACFPLDAEEWRTWFNVHQYVFRHGLMLGNLTTTQRDLALTLVSRSLSPRGYGQARDIMRLNALLGELASSPTEFDEWYYFLSVFGNPSANEPWGWQLDGHHLNINCMVVGEDMVLTPTFMGSEPCSVSTGPLAGVEVFAAELAGGLELINSLSADQQQQALLYPSILPGTLPPHLDQWIDGRMQAAAFRDNAVLPYQGIRADDLDEAQRAVLMSTLEGHLGWARADHAAARKRQVEDHLDDTWFSWLGGIDGDAPFYYRIHSPAVLVELDQHPGTVLDIPEPSRHHIHTIIRTPNGGDYGADLLAQHYARNAH
jgi:hypothetical protein